MMATKSSHSYGYIKKTKNTSAEGLELRLSLNVFNSAEAAEVFKYLIWKGSNITKY